MDHPATQPRGTHRKSQPKKGGAGGKGTWGKAGEQMTVPKVQEADPNFDQEENITWQVADVSSSAPPAAPRASLHHYPSISRATRHW